MCIGKIIRVLFSKDEGWQEPKSNRAERAQRIDGWINNAFSKVQQQEHKKVKVRHGSQ